MSGPCARRGLLRGVWPWRSSSISSSKTKEYLSTQSDLESNLGKIPSRHARPRRTDRRLGAGEADWAHGRIGQQTHRMLDWCLAGRIASPLVECACSHRAIMRTTAGQNFAPSDCRIQAAYGIALCSRERIPSRMRASVFDENEPCVNHVRVSAYLLSIKLSAKVTHLTVCGRRSRGCDSNMDSNSGSLSFPHHSPH